MTEIERGYEQQGYQLPDGLSWDTVADARKRFGIGEIYVPVVCGPGCIGWGVPMRDGKFLEHP